MVLAGGAGTRYRDTKKQRVLRRQFRVDTLRLHRNGFFISHCSFGASHREGLTGASPFISLYAASSDVHMLERVAARVRAGGALIF